MWLPTRKGPLKLGRATGSWYRIGYLPPTLPEQAECQLAGPGYPEPSAQKCSPSKAAERPHALPQIGLEAPKLFSSLWEHL